MALDKDLLKEKLESNSNLIKVAANKTELYRSNTIARPTLDCVVGTWLS